MFGYVTANCRALTQQQLERYRGCYCGLCRAIGDKYGSAARLTVSYDVTFLVLLLSSLTESEETASSSRCITHRIKAQDSWSNQWTDYGADITILLAWHNFDDSVRDGKRISAVGRAALEKAYKKAGELRPKEDAVIKEAMDRLRKVQDDLFSDQDAAAKVFGNMLGQLFSVAGGHWKAVMYDIGDYLGRFIYMADAAADIKKDIRSGNYNPLKQAYLDGERDFSDILSMLMSQCTRRFEILPLVQDMAILRNILYSGVWQKIADSKSPGKECGNR